MSQLRQQQDRLDELNIKVKVVTFDNDSMAKAYVQENKLSWPLLLDTKRELYSAYGMEKGSLWSLANPVAIVRYVWLMLNGKNLGKPGSDLFQLGGDILIDPEGIVRMHHASIGPHDRPSPKSNHQKSGRLSRGDNDDAGSRGTVLL